MTTQEKLAYARQSLEEFYREERDTRRVPREVQRIGDDMDDDSGDIFQGREDDEQITRYLD